MTADRPPDRSSHAMNVRIASDYCVR